MTSTIALIERLRRAETELKDAWREAHCCDDIKLDQPLSGFISDLQAKRVEAATELTKAEADLRGFKSARVAYFVTDAWGGYWQTQIDGIPYNFSTGNKRDQQKEIGRAERAEAQRDEAKVVEADALKRVDEWKARAELAESQRDTAIRERDELRMELESKYEDDAGASI